MESTLQLQKKAFSLDPQPDLEQRKRNLWQLAEMIKRHQHEFAHALDADFGLRNPTETRLVDVFPLLELIRYNRKHLHRWMKPEKRQSNRWFFPAKSMVIPCPKGVVGIISPGNYPLLLSLGPVAQALAAGNRVMLKLSEHTPAFSDLLKRTLSEVFNEDQVAVFLGGPDAGAAFSALPLDHLLFTGSIAVGKRVMQAAAQNLTPVTLELGGKCPSLLLSDADFKDAAKKIILTKCFNSGQSCIASDYVLLPEERMGEFIDLARSTFHSLYPHWHKNKDFTSLSTPAAYAKFQEIMRETNEAGCEVIPLAQDSAREARRIFAPHLVLNPPLDLRIMQEELFSPILPVIGYSSVKEALEIIQENPRPLALYIFSQDIEIAKSLGLHVPSGGVCINECMYHIAQESLPFGGTGNSGIGQYMGREGFLTFSQLRPFFTQSPASANFLASPPYGARVKSLLKLMIR